MGTKTIGLREEVYERLKARKREGESFSDLIDRLVDERRTDWREGFGTLPEGAVGDLEATARASRRDTADGLAKRSNDAIEALSSDRGTTTDDDPGENER